MRLLRVRVPEYGPLRQVELEVDAGLTVVHGPNEAGKTALLDFLLGHLFRKEGRAGTQLATVMRGVHRFGDPADRGGELTLRLDGRVLAYPGSPSLLDRLGLEYVGLSGLFCVRSGELDWPGTDESRFWTALKKLLSGLPEGVDTLKKQVHAEGELTPTGRLSDRGDPGAKSRHVRLEERISRLEELRDRLPEAYRRDAAIADLQRRAEQLEVARRERIALLHGRLVEAEEELDASPGLAEETLERWRELRSDVRRLEGEIREREEELREARERRSSLQSELREARRRAGELRDRLSTAEDRELGERARELASSTAPDRAVEPTLLWGGAAVSAGLALALGVVGLYSLEAGAALALLALGGGGLLHGIRRHRERRERHDLEAASRALRRDAATAELDVPDLGDIPAAVEGLRTEAARAEVRVQERRERVADATSTVEDREEVLERARQEKEAAEEEVREIRRELGVEDLGSATELRREREALEREASELRSSLRELAGPEREAWDVEPPADSRRELPEWNADRRREVGRQLERARSEYQELRDEFKKSGIDRPEDVLSDLTAARAELRGIELDREAARLAGRVFEDMDEALDRRLRTVFDRDGPFSVGRLVDRITGRYARVRREEGDAISVLDDDGRRFELGALSRGTRDQVYLALRIALADAALHASGVEEGGFLLLDDAFLTADWQRRERLVATAADLSGQGWQVVYLTCDDHLRELFVEQGAALHEL